MILSESNIIGMQCTYKDGVECLVTNVYFYMEEKFPYTCSALAEIVPINDNHPKCDFDWYDETQEGVFIGDLTFKL